VPSRPGEFHPEPLTQPDLTLSRHPAHATARRLPPSIEHRVPPVAGCPEPNGDGPLPSLRGHYTRFIATTKRSAPARRIGTFGLAVGAACAFSLGIADQVLTFRTRAWLSFAPLHAGCRLGRLRTSPKLIPEEGSPPGFDIVQSAFDTSSTVCLRSPLSTLPAGILSRRFRNVHHHRF
jgi:hypothetical protein